MSLTKGTNYAIQALIALAKNPNKPMKIAEIAKLEGISFAYLNKVFQKLAKSKIVIGKTGVSGGVKLNRKPSKITLQEIIESIQGKNILKSFKDEVDKNMKVMNPILQKYLTEAEKQLLIYFRKATLQDLIKA